MDWMFLFSCASLANRASFFLFSKHPPVSPRKIKRGKEEHQEVKDEKQYHHHVKR